MDALFSSDPQQPDSLPRASNDDFDGVLRQMKQKYDVVDDAPVSEPRARLPRASSPASSFDATSRVRDLAPEYGVPSNLAVRVVRQESGGRQYDASGRVLTSPKGARGAMQVLPETGRAHGYDVDDPEQNVRAGLDYLGRSYKRWNGDPALTVAGYHAGIEDADRAMRNPRGNPKTHNYVRSILGDDAYNQAVGRYGQAPPQAPRNSFDDVLSGIRAKYDPPSLSGAEPSPKASGNSFDAAPAPTNKDSQPQASTPALTDEQFNALSEPEKHAHVAGLLNDLKSSGARPAPDDDAPVKLRADQDANTPVAPDISQVGEKIAVPANRVTHTMITSRPVYLGDFADQIKGGKVDVKKLTDTINQRIYGDLAGAHNLNDADVRTMAKPYTVEQVQAALPGIKAELDDPQMNGHISYRVPADFGDQLSRVSQDKAHQFYLQQVASLSPEDKQLLTQSLAHKGPIPDDVRQALGVGTSLPRTALSGFGKSIGETMKGVGRIDSYIPGQEAAAGLLSELGDDFSQGGQEGLNTYKPQGFIGSVAQGVGEVAPDVATSLVLPESVPLHLAYWGGLGATKELGRGGDLVDAAKSGAINAAMVGAAAPLRPVAGAVGDSLAETAAKTATRMGGGYAMGYSLARAQGASPDEATAQGIQFAGMNMLGGKRALDDHVQVAPGEAPHVAEVSPNDQRETDLHHSNYQPRNGTGQFLEGKPVAPGSESQPTSNAFEDALQEIRQLVKASPVADSMEQPPVTKNKYSSTQVNLPEEHANAVRDLAGRIPDNVLAEDGREDNPHVTVKYGLHNDEVEPVRQALADEPPIKATIGKAIVFPAGESGDSDVVKLDVDSPDLHRLNKKIADAAPHTDTFPDYKPHVTLAYVKPGEGQAIADKLNQDGHPLFGQEVTMPEVTFSDRNGDKTVIPLKGAAEDATEPLRPFTDAVRSAAEAKPAADEPDFVRAARERLRQQIAGNQLNANPLGALRDTAIITGYDVFKGTMDKAAWAREMTLRLGQKVKPLLDDVWEHLTTGKFGVADVRRQLEQTRLVPAKMIEEALSGERPEHINSIVDFLGEQRQKVRDGAMTPSDVARAYFMTVASQGTDAIKVDTLQAKLKDAGVNIDIPDNFTTTNKNGEKMIRPEDAAGSWLLSPTGQKALSDLEAGKFNEAAWREGAKVRAAFGDDRVSKNNVLGQATRGAFNMRNLSDLLPALNDAKGDSRKVAALISKLNGVGSGKTPFLKHLLGFGDAPTVDAVEINTWLTGRGSTRGQSGRSVELARAVKDFSGNAALSSDISRRITNRFKDLQKSGRVGSELSADDFGHVVHHWLWDKMKGTVNPQRGMYDAMRAEPDFVARSRARLREVYSGQRLNANPVHDLYDLAVVTGYDLYTKAKGFGEWSRRMVNEFGPDVQQHLPDIWGQLEDDSNRMFAARASQPTASQPSSPAPTAAQQSQPRAASSSLPPPDESVMGGPDESGKTPGLSVLDSYIRANILAGPSPFTHKLGSLTASTVAEEAARPFAAAPDAIVSKITGDRRQVLLDPRGLARAATAAVTKGIPESLTIMRRGFTPEQAAFGKLPNEITGRNPILSAYINGVFRLYKAGVHPFEIFASTRAMGNQALAMAQAEAKAGMIGRSEVRARADEIARGENVRPDVAGMMEHNAMMAAADATFQRDNAVSRKWSDVRKAVGPGWAFAMNRAVEFTRTPINALIKTVELTPGLGQAKESLIDLQNKLRTGEWLPDDADKERFAKAWGRLPVGLGLFMLGGYLHRHGLMTGIIDDRKQKAMDRAEGKTPGSLQIAPNTWLDVMRYSAPGAVMAMGATWDYYANGQGAGRDEGSIKDAMSDLYHTLAPTAESLPFAQNPARALDPKAQAAKLLPGYSTVRDVYRGDQSAIGSAVPPARWMFGQSGPDVLGRKPEDQGFLNTVLHVHEGQPSPALDEMRANGVDYSRPWRRPDESNPAYNARVARQGKALEDRVSSLKQSPQYQQAADGADGAAFKKKALEIANLTAREDAETGRPAREGDAAVMLYNTRVALQTRNFIREQRKTETYRNLSQPERQRFEQAIEARMQGAHAMLSGSGNPGERISASAARFRDLMNDPGAIIREAARRAKGAR